MLINFFTALAIDFLIRHANKTYLNLNLTTSQLLLQCYV